MSRTPDSQVATTIEFAKLVDGAIREYNATRHRGIKTSPIARLLASGRSFEAVPEREVALALLRREDVTVTRAGVELNGILYQGAATAAHVGDRLEAGWLATRPDFIELFDPARPKAEQWLGHLRAMPAASDRLSGAIKEARRLQIETVERAEQGARALRARELAQLRGGVVADPGTTPRTAKAPRQPRNTPKVSEPRRARLANAAIWKETKA